VVLICHLTLLTTFCLQATQLVSGHLIPDSNAETWPVSCTCVDAHVLSWPPDPWLLEMKSISPQPHHQRYYREEALIKSTKLLGPIKVVSVTSVLVFSASGSSLSGCGLQPSTFERNASTCNEIHLTAMQILVAEPELALRNVGPWGLCPKNVKKEECLVTSVFLAEAKITKWRRSKIRPVWTRLSVMGVINERQT
jgi:hypothetical protein